jgi:hypothetical protein
VNNRPWIKSDPKNHLYLGNRSLLQVSIPGTSLFNGTRLQYTFECPNCTAQVNVSQHFTATMTYPVSRIFRVGPAIWYIEGRALYLHQDNASNTKIADLPDDVRDCTLAASTGATKAIACSTAAYY